MESINGIKLKKNDCLHIQRARAGHSARKGKNRLLTSYVLATQSETCGVPRAPKQLNGITAKRTSPLGELKFRDAHSDPPPSPLENGRLEMSIAGF